MLILWQGMTVCLLRRKMIGFDEKEFWRRSLRMDSENMKVSVSPVNAHQRPPPAEEVLIPRWTRLLIL